MAPKTSIIESIWNDFMFPVSLAVLPLPLSKRDHLYCGCVKKKV